MKKILAIVLCLLPCGGSITQAQSARRVEIINRSSSPVAYLHASNPDRPKWEQDLLGPLRVIRPGHSIDARIDDGSGHCRYDLQAVLLDGRETLQSDFDVCANISWTVKIPD